MSTNLFDLLSSVPLANEALNPNTESWINTYNPANDPNAVGIEQPIIPPRPSVAPTTNTAAQPSLTQQIAQGIGTAIDQQLGSSVFGNAIAAFKALPSVVDIVAIIVGLVLLAGAVFGFRNVTSTVVQTTRKGAELTAL